MTSAVPHPALRARGIDPYANTLFGWYGQEPAFQILVERNIKYIPEKVTRSEATDAELVYTVAGLDVPGDLERHNLEIKFLPIAPAWACGIPACDCPSVFTDIDRPRLHQNGDESLCMWAPFDPPERRWWHRDGLHALVEIARRHLLLEIHWFRTGAIRGGKWAVEDAPHGEPDVWSAW